MIALRPDAATEALIGTFTELFTAVGELERTGRMTDGWQRLAGADVLRADLGTTTVPAVTAGILAAEQAGRHLVGLRYLDTLVAADLLQVCPAGPLGAAMSKWYNSDIAGRIAALALACDGLDGVLSAGATGIADGGFVEWLQREVPGMTISAGTAEIMLYVVAGAEVGRA